MRLEPPNNLRATYVEILLLTALTTIQNMHGIYWIETLSLSNYLSFSKPLDIINSQLQLLP